MECNHKSFFTNFPEILYCHNANITKLLTDLLFMHKGLNKCQQTSVGKKLACNVNTHVLLRNVAFFKA